MLLLILFSRSVQISFFNKFLHFDSYSFIDIQAITLSDEWVAVATDKRNIRIFSIGGVQRDLFSIPGPVVTMSAHTNQLLIIYHRGMGKSIHFNKLYILQPYFFLFRNYSPHSIREEMNISICCFEGIPGDQNLGTHLVQVTGRKKFVMNGQSLPISPKSTLAWTG